VGDWPLALIPLRSAEGAAGGLLGVALPRGEDARVVRTLTTFALEAGLALTNAMLYSEILTREEELETIVFSVRLPILLVDDHGRFRAINPAAAETFRISPDLELEQLIEDLLYVSRIEASRPPLHIAWDDLVEVGKRVIDEFRRRDLSRPITLRTSVPQIPLQMDKTKVEQIIYHLIDNAVKYSDAGTPVTVELAPTDEEVRVTVIDRGVGIFSGDLPRLFRPFGQLDSRSTRRHGGTGVGLYVCKTLADTLGGRIWADSTLGKGSKFSFTIPKSPPAGPGE